MATIWYREGTESVSVFSITEGGYHGLRFSKFTCALNLQTPDIDVVVVHRPTLRSVSSPERTHFEVKPVEPS